MRESFMSMDRPSNLAGDDEETKYGIDHLPEVKGGECSFGKDEKRTGKE